MCTDGRLAELHHTAKYVSIHCARLLCAARTKGGFSVPFCERWNRFHHLPWSLESYMETEIAKINHAELIPMESPHLKAPKKRQLGYWVKIYHTQLGGRPMWWVFGEVGARGHKDLHRRWIPSSSATFLHQSGMALASTAPDLRLPSSAVGPIRSLKACGEGLLIPPGSVFA